MVRYYMSAGGAGISVTVVVKPFHFLPGSVFAEDGLVEFFLFLFVKAQRGLQVKAATGDKITGKDLFGHIVDHDLFDEPGATLGQTPGEALGLFAAEAEVVLAAGQQTRIAPHRQAVAPGDAIVKADRISKYFDVSPPWLNRVLEGAPRRLLRGILSVLIAGTAMKICYELLFT